MIGAAVTAVAGLAQTGIGLIQANKAKREAGRREAAVRDLISKTPDFRDSEAYSMGQQQVGYAQRFSDHGLEQNQISYMGDMADRSAAYQVQNAGNLRAGLLGASSAGRSLMDAYRSIGVQDAEMKLRKKNYYHQMLQNMQGLQQQAYEVDLGKQNALIDLESGLMDRASQEQQTHMKTVNNGLNTMIGGAGGLLDKIPINWGKKMGKAE
jgi:hypothetical protein